MRHPFKWEYLRSKPTLSLKSRSKWWLQTSWVLNSRGASKWTQQNENLWNVLVTHYLFLTFSFFCKKSTFTNFVDIFFSPAVRTPLSSSTLCVVSLFRENITNGCFLKSILATSCCDTFVTFLVLTCPKKIQEQSHFNVFFPFVWVKLRILV